MRTGKPTKSEISRACAEADDAAVFAMHCDGCPYRTCVGATATLDYDGMVERWNLEAPHD